MPLDPLPQVAEPRTAARPRWLRFSWIKVLLGLALAALLVAEAVYLWPRLRESWHSITQLNWAWLAASIALQAISISGYARTQRQLLHAAGVWITQRDSLKVIYASTALATTLPAGQVFSAAFTYRQQRKWGASPLVASWQLAVSGVIHAAGLALLGVAGAMLVGGSVNPLSLVLSFGMLGLLIWLAKYAASHPGTVEKITIAAVARLNQFRGRPRDAGLQKVREIVTQLDSVELSRRDGALTLWWAVVHRGADIGSLAMACYAVGADPRWGGVVLAFAVGKAVGSIPFAPGGIVYVDATLITALHSAGGIPAAQAVAAAFVYRAVSFILVAIVGWLVVLIFFRGQRRDAVREEPALSPEQR